MSDDLYFIPLITSALRESGPNEAMRAAFCQIQVMGQEDRYRRGFEQFQRFMKCAAQQNASNSSALGESVADVESYLARMTELLGDDELRPRAGSGNLQGQEEHDSLWAQVMEVLERPTAVTVIVEKDNVAIGSWRLGQGDEKKRSIGGVGSGEYRIRLDTGLVLWEGRFSDEDLLWSKAFPGQPMRVAADTGEADRHPTRELELLNGMMIVHVIPGPSANSGVLTIELCDAGT